jgi:hypothetical protein
MLVSNAYLFVVSSFTFLMASVASTTSCQTLNKRPCRRNASCQWNKDFEVCIDAPETPVVSEKPTNQPTRQPTRQPTVTSLSNCPSLAKKRKCKQVSLCKWDDNFGVCAPSGSKYSSSKPTIAPTPSVSKNPSSKPTSSPTNHPASTNLCLTDPEDVYRTCFQRAIDPSNNLTEDTILRNEYNKGDIAPYTVPYVTSDEELTYETIYLSSVRNDSSTLDCNEKIRLEEISLMWLKVSFIGVIHAS